MSIIRDANDVTSVPDLVAFVDSDVSTRKCPFCAETISGKATVCIHCESRLDGGKANLKSQSGFQKSGRTPSVTSEREKFCTNCGGGVDPNAMACTNCGSRPKSYKSFCYCCGDVVRAEQIVCLKCGSALPKGVTANIQSVSRCQTYCTNCGHQVDSKALACINCGSSPRSQRKFCSHCSASLNPEQVICLKCGAGLREPMAGVPARLLEHLRAQSLPTDPLQRAILMVGILVAMAIAIYPPWNISELGFTRQLGHSWIWEPLTVNDFTAYIDLTRLCIYWVITASATTLALLWVKSR